MVDYLGPAASLLESNTRAGTAQQDRQAQRGMKNQELLESTVNNVAAENMKNKELLQSGTNAQLAEKGAMDRTQVQGKQAQLLQNLRDHADAALETMKQQEESKRQEKALKEAHQQHYQQNYFTMTPNTVAGIKDSIGLDFSKLEGQEVNKDVILGLISAKYKTDIADTAANAKKNSGAGAKDLQKELDRIEGNIKGNRDKLFGMSLKDLPTEVWQGGKPGDMRTLIQNISHGKLANLSPEAQSQVQMVAGYINTMKSQQERANKIHEQLGTTVTDYTGMGIGGDSTAPQKKYSSAQEVQAAFHAGTLDRVTAKKILQDQFHLK